MEQKADKWVCTGPNSAGLFNAQTQYCNKALQRPTLPAATRPKSSIENGYQDLMHAFVLPPEHYYMVLFMLLKQEMLLEALRAAVSFRCNQAMTLCFFT